MAYAGKLGVPHVRSLQSEFNRVQFLVSYSSFSRVTWASQTAKQYAGIALPGRSKKTLVVSCGATPNIESPIESEEASKERSSSHPPSQLIPNAHDVEFLVTELCGTTKIAEFELKLNGFRLHITRALGRNPQPPSLPSASTNVGEVAEAPVQNGSVMATSLAIFKPGAYGGNFEKKLLDSAADNGLELIRSPKVGLFRRSRMIKKKRAPPPCKEGQVVKEGQVLCYVEQLGGQFAVESHVAGEVVKFLLEDDDPVGYGDPVVAILPSFPGIKKLQ